MGGSSVDDDWELTFPSIAVRTFVLVGRTGNGKSATGNTIIGTKAFKSRASSSGVTSSCDRQQTKLKDGEIINVIDTPGLFDVSVGSVGKEIVKCIDWAKDGIHAVLAVFSVRTRFSQEEEDALCSLGTLFGSKIFDYMIVVFTGGDDLEDNGQTLEDYLEECPEPLKDILALCNNRRVLFDNKTKDELKKEEQLQQLLSLVNKITSHTGGQPYTDEVFAELKKGDREIQDQQEKVKSLIGYSEYSKHEISELKEQINASYEQQLKRITEMVEAKLKDSNSRLEQQLAEEQAARLKSQDAARVAQEKANDEIRILRENLEKAQKETEELKEGKNRCHIL